MDILSVLVSINWYLAIPTSFLLLITALYLTSLLQFIQLRSWSRFFNLVTKTIQSHRAQKKGTITPFQALFTAMSTSIGIGTIVGPSIAIITGGPGALLWLIIYALSASIIKFAEVTFAIHFRRTLPDGSILGGPMQYLHTVHPWLGQWYAYATVVLFASWSGVQSNVLAETLLQESIPLGVTGACLALLVYGMLSGGARRIGEFNSALVPIMTILYISASLYILSANYHLIPGIIRLVLRYSIAPAPIIGGFAGASVFAALRSGVYKSAYITESGMGTAAIPHSLANVQCATDQGILAMMSVFADTVLCMLSGFLILTTNFWQTPTISNTLMYKVFQHHVPFIGRPILVITITLFAIGTIIGNSFNGRQSFAAITQYRFLSWYHAYICLIIFLGSLSDVPLVWNTIDILLPLIAIPNVIVIWYLATKHKSILEQ